MSKTWFSNTELFVEHIRDEFPEVVLLGDPDDERLRQRTRQITGTEFHSGAANEHAELLLDFIRRYRGAFGVGTGVAANQLRSMPLIRMAAVAFGSTVTIVANGELTKPIGQGSYHESCMSAPRVACDVIEPYGITLDHKGVKGESYTRDLMASDARRAIHEMRHLNGNMCTDPGRARSTIPIEGGIQQIINNLPPAEQLDSPQ